MPDTFMRTPAGITNYNLFYHTDIVVFVEGVAPEEKKASDDVFFGETLFQHFLPNVNFTIKGCGGSKTLLYKYLDSVQKGVVGNNVYIAKDRDYDYLCWDGLHHKNIFLTYGYCFENDLINIDVLKNIIRLSIRDRRHDQLIADLIDAFLKEFTSCARWLLAADIILKNTGVSAINKDRHTGDFIRIDSAGKPTLDRGSCRARIKGCSDRSLCEPLPQRIDVLSLCKGKIVFFYLKTVAVYIVKKLSQRNTTGMDAKIMSAFFESLECVDSHFSNDKLNYYKSILVI